MNNESRFHGETDRQKSQCERQTATRNTDKRMLVINHQHLLFTFELRTSNRPIGFKEKIDANDKR